MPHDNAYIFYESGQAVAAAHLGLEIRQVSANPAQTPTDILIPRNDRKMRMILWLTGMAAEKKCLGRDDPLRRTRNRLRVRQLVESMANSLTGPAAKRLSQARTLLNQAQDRANDICSNLAEAIQATATRLQTEGVLAGGEIVAIVTATKADRRRRNGHKLPAPASETPTINGHHQESAANGSALPTTPPVPAIPTHPNPTEPATFAFTVR